MKPTTYFFFTLLSLSLFSCQEVIELDLNDADPQLVVDATLTDAPLSSQVILTRSGSYFEPGNYERVSGATVELSASNGDSWLLAEKDSGLYAADGLVGEIGETYTLSVEVDGEMVSGQSKMLAPVQLDSVDFQRLEGQNPRLPSSYLMRAYFDDPVDESVYMRFMVWVNDTLDRGIYLYDGGTLTENDGIARFIGLPLDQGDTVRIMALRIERDVYQYYFELADVAGVGSLGPGSAAPANPTTNLSGDVLGYFGAMSATQYLTVVP